MTRHLLIGCGALVAVTLPCDIAGIRSPLVVAAGVIAGVGGMLLSAWRADRRAGRLRT